MNDVTIWDHALALLVGLLLPLGGLLQQRGGDDEPTAFSTRDKIAGYWSNSALLGTLAGITLVVWHTGERSLATLGLTRAPSALGAGLGIAALFLVLYTLDTRRQLGPERLAETRERWRRHTPFMPTTPLEVRHSLAMVASAAVFEEIVFRGFLIAYVAHFTGTSPPGLALAVALPTGVFALCHLYQGWRAAAKIALLSAFFGALLVVTGSLWIPIALHFVVDLIGVLLGPRILGEAD